MKINKLSNKEEKILEVLEKLQTVPTSRISNEINSNYFNTLNLLEGLLRKKLIKRLQQGKYIYWELK